MQLKEALLAYSTSTPANVNQASVLDDQGRPSGQKSTSATLENQGFLLQGAQSMP